MATPTTLSEYYGSQGQALPSVSEGTQGVPTTGAVQPATIPANVAVGGVQQLDLPSQPQSQATTNLYSSAASYFQTLPKTGQFELDAITQSMIERPGQLAEQYGVSEKQSKAVEAARKLELFNEDFRVRAERLRTEGGRSAAQVDANLAEMERKRAFGAGTLAIEAAFAQQDYQGARELMNQQVELELEPRRMRYQFFKDRYERTEDQKFQRAMRAEDRAYQTEKARLEVENELKLSTIGLMDSKQAGEFVKDATAKQAQARAGVIQAVNNYVSKLAQFKGGNTDWNRLTREEKLELQTALRTTVGSAINVAQGQGAMGEEEGKRILGNLEPTRWKRTSVFQSSGKGIVDAQRDFLKSELQFLSMKYPSASSLPVFTSALSDEDFFSSGTMNAMSVPATTYFGNI